MNSTRYWRIYFRPPAGLDFPKSLKRLIDELRIKDAFRYMKAEKKRTTKGLTAGTDKPQ